MKETIRVPIAGDVFAVERISDTIINVGVETEGSDSYTVAMMSRGEIDELLRLLTHLKVALKSDYRGS